jgi:hypothetical protein
MRAAVLIALIIALNAILITKARSRRQVSIFTVRAATRSDIVSLTLKGGDLADPRVVESDDWLPVRSLSMFQI